MRVDGSLNILGEVRIGDWSVSQTSFMGFSEPDAFIDWSPRAIRLTEDRNRRVILLDYHFGALTDLFQQIVQIPRKLRLTDVHWRHNLILRHLGLAKPPAPFLCYTLDSARYKGGA